MATIDILAFLNLSGRNVLITGAGGGIGRCLVERFEAAGAVVSGADVSEELMQGLNLAHRITFDVTDAAAVRQAIADLDKFGAGPDVLISNVGFTRGETLSEVDAAVFSAEVAVNLTGAFNVAAPVIELMTRRGGGSIVFISSVNALAHYGNPAYSAAKAGLIGYAKAIAVECGKSGIRANVICPGSVRTPAWDHRFEKTPDLLGRVIPHYPLGRLVTSDEVANAAIFLASDMASGMTGAVLAVDAGLTAGNLRFVNDVIGAN